MKKIMLVGMMVLGFTLSAFAQGGVGNDPKKDLVISSELNGLIVDGIICHQYSSDEKFLGHILMNKPEKFREANEFLKNTKDAIKSKEVKQAIKDIRLLVEDTKLKLGINYEMHVNLSHDLIINSTKTSKNTLEFYIPISFKNEKNREETKSFRFHIELNSKQSKEEIIKELTVKLKNLKSTIALYFSYVQEMRIEKFKQEIVKFINKNLPFRKIILCK